MFCLRLNKSSGRSQIPQGTVNQEIFLRSRQHDIAQNRRCRSLLLSILKNRLRFKLTQLQLVYELTPNREPERFDFCIGHIKEDKFSGRLNFINETTLH